jgi:hypothetical protein
MPSARVRYAAEVAFLVLVALGLLLAQFDPVVIGAILVVAVILVALLERAASRVEARAGTAEPAPSVPTELVERVEAEEPEPTPTVNERSARAILASAPPPLPPEPPKSARRRFVQRAPAPPPPAPEPEPVAVPAGPPREWNLWDLQRAVRDAPDAARHEEWAALLIHLREFANPDGGLSVEFDALVRESFAPILETEPEPAAAP